jgi:hypothetical protein
MARSYAGVRKPDGTDHNILLPTEYCRDMHMVWWLRPPYGSAVNVGKQHKGAFQIREHSDGSVSVQPPFTSQDGANIWTGVLAAGFFRELSHIKKGKKIVS